MPDWSKRDNETLRGDFHTLSEIWRRDSPYYALAQQWLDEIWEVLETRNISSVYDYLLNGKEEDKR